MTDIPLDVTHRTLSVDDNVVKTRNLNVTSTIRDLDNLPPLASSPA